MSATMDQLRLRATSPTNIRVKHIQTLTWANLKAVIINIDENKRPTPHIMGSLLKKKKDSLRTPYSKYYHELFTFH